MPGPSAPSPPSARTPQSPRHLPPAAPNRPTPKPPQTNPPPDLVKIACALQLASAGLLFYGCQFGLHLDAGDSLRAVAGLGLGYFARIFIPIEQLVRARGARRARARGGVCLGRASGRHADRQGRGCPGFGGCRPLNSRWGAPKVLAGCRHVLLGAQKAIPLWRPRTSKTNSRTSAIPGPLTGPENSKPGVAGVQRPPAAHQPQRRLRGRVRGTRGAQQVGFLSAACVARARTLECVGVGAPVLTPNCWLASFQPWAVLCASLWGSQGASRPRNQRRGETHPFLLQTGPGQPPARASKPTTPAVLPLRPLLTKDAQLTGRRRGRGVPLPALPAGLGHGGHAAGEGAALGGGWRRGARLAGLGLGRSVALGFRAMRRGIRCGRCCTPCTWKPEAQHPSPSTQDNKTLPPAAAKNSTDCPAHAGRPLPV